MVAAQGASLRPAAVRGLEVSAKAAKAANSAKASEPEVAGQLAAASKAAVAAAAVRGRAASAAKAAAGRRRVLFWRRRRRRRRQHEQAVAPPGWARCVASGAARAPRAGERFRSTSERAALERAVAWDGRAGEHSGLVGGLPKSCRFESGRGGVRLGECGSAGGGEQVLQEDYACTSLCPGRDPHSARTIYVRHSMTTSCGARPRTAGREMANGAGQTLLDALVWAARLRAGLANAQGAAWLVGGGARSTGGRLSLLRERRE